MTPPTHNELLQDDLQQRANNLQGDVQGHHVTFDGIHWTCTVGVEFAVGDDTTEVEAVFDEIFDPAMIEVLQKNSMVVT